MPASRSAPREPEVVEVKNRAAWRRWLTKHHAASPGIWLVIHKAGAKSGELRYEDAVLEALCFGWIDSKPNSMDEERYKLWLAPRKPKGVWSAINKRRAEELLGAGLMTDAGLAAIRTAKENGAWTALAKSDSLEIPEDLGAALDGVSNARVHFEAFPPGIRKQILEWIHMAKRPETRATRVEEAARLAGENVRANQWRRP
jgi:uncharacterized protein YdeI (YjbR/CyaY-like superfamily)